jgi:hypothetical protein
MRSRLCGILIILNGMDRPSRDQIQRSAIDFLSLVVGNPDVAAFPLQLGPRNTQFVREGVCAVPRSSGVLQDHSSLIPRVIVDHQVEMEPRHLAAPHRIACVTQAPRISGIWVPLMFAAMAAPISKNVIVRPNANEACRINSSY